MQTERFSEEIKIRSIQAGVRRNKIGAWTCLALAGVFAFLGAQVQATSNRQPGADWVIAVTFFVVVVVLNSVALIAWCLVSRDRKRLAQLKAVASTLEASERPGVWPPPPKER